MISLARRIACVSILFLDLACGSAPPPTNALPNAPDLLGSLKERRNSIESFRITGKVDHFGEEHRVQGKVFIFARLPDRLRIELVSPFNSPMSVMTVKGGRFSLHDLREGRFFTGPAEPCNIARLVHIPLPAEDVLSILMGDTPVIQGLQKTSWDENGFYRIEIRGDKTFQTLEIGSGGNMLPLNRSLLEDKSGTIFDIRYDRWFKTAGKAVPREIRVKIPREKTDLLLRYDEGGVEINVDLPEEAWNQAPPSGLEAEEVACN